MGPSHSFSLARVKSSCSDGRVRLSAFAMNSAPLPSHTFVAPHGWRIPSGNGGSPPCPVPVEGKALSKPALWSLSDKRPAISQESLSPMPDKGFLFIFLPSGCLGWMLAILYAYFCCCSSCSKGPGEGSNQTCGDGASAARGSSPSHLDMQITKI